MDLVSFKLVVWSQTVFTAILALGLEGARLRKVASWIRRSVHTKEKLAMQPWPWKLPGKPDEFCSFWKLGQSFATWRQTCTGHPAKEGPGGGRREAGPWAGLLPSCRRGLCCERGGHMGKNWSTWRGAQAEPWQSPGFFHPWAPRIVSAACFFSHPASLEPCPSGIFLSPRCQKLKANKMPFSRRIDKLEYSYTVKYYSVIKKKWAIKRQNAMEWYSCTFLSESRQCGKVIYYIMPTIWLQEKMLLKMLKRLMVAWGPGVGKGVNRWNTEKF